MKFLQNVILSAAKNLDPVRGFEILYHDKSVGGHAYAKLRHGYITPSGMLILLPSRALPAGALHPA